MKPFYQGMIDTFCAIYAVLNALRLTHSIRVDKARSIFSEAILDLAKSPDRLQAVLEQTTDYIFLVDDLLEKCSKRFPLYYYTPYSDNDFPSVDDLWKKCSDWINADKNRTIILRFFRFTDPNAFPIVRHWTTIETIGEESLHLYDCSHEANAILNLQKNSIVTDLKDVSKDILLYVQPSSLRFLRLPF